MAEMKISNTLVNDTNTGVVAYAEQLKDAKVNYSKYSKLTNEIVERFGLDTKFQDKLNDFFLYHYDEFHRFLEDPGLDDSIIDSWKEIQDFLNGLPDDETMWLKNKLQQLDNRITAMDIPDGGAYDVSADHVDGGGVYAEYATLANALAAIDVSDRKSGMTIRFINSVSHKYEQWRYLNEYKNTIAGNAAFVNVANWTKGNSDGIYDVSVENAVNGTPATYETLALALAAIPAHQRVPGMSIKFIQTTPATYNVVKTEGVTELPTGTLLDSASSIGSGTYTASQLTDFSTLPTTNAVTYYVAVTEDETTTYTTWVITLAQSSDNKYVQCRLMTNGWSTNPENWAICVDTVLVENPEFIAVYIDNDDRIIKAIKADGTEMLAAGLEVHGDISADGADITMTENPEFFVVYLDKDDKILFGVQKNANFFFGAGVPQQIVDYINEKISELSLEEYEDIVVFLSDYLGSDTTLKTMIDGINAQIATKADKVEGKSLIDEEYASTKSTIDNPEFLEVTTDSEDKVLEGIKTDGTKIIGGDTQIGGNATILGNVDIQGATYTLMQNPEWIMVIVDAQNHILCGIKAADESLYLNSLTEIPSIIQDAINAVSVDTASLDERITALESIFHISDNQEYIQVTTDSVGKILQSRNPEGVNKEYVGIETPSLKVNDIEIADNVDAIDTMSVINDPEGRIKIYTDSKKRILSYRDSNGILHEEVGINTNHMGLSSAATQDIINALNTLGYSANNPIDWSDSEFVEIPTPTVCAVVNIEVDGQAEAKGSDIPTYIQFWDKAGNYFRKPIVLNAQGSSSMSYHIKNQAIDFTDDSKIKFGNWIPCDSFHIKKYFIDVFRGQCIVGYWLTEQMYQTRPYGERRPWDYLNSFNDVDNSNGSFSKDYYTGALAHPDGFPVKVFFNGKNAGVYAFNLKKDRANYYCKKDKQKQIILDGILGSTFWTANGDLTQPGEDGGNIWHDFEVRNPKISKDINGNNYDGDNPTEPSNDYDTTKAAIERLTTAIPLVNLESTTEAKKAKFEEFFNIPFLIDYDLIGQVIHNYDGYRKNWIWITNDGNKWCPTSYDMDSIFGQHWNGASYVQSSITDILGNSNYLPTGSDLLKGLYQTEMRARYKELRDKGIFSVDNIIGLLEKWINSCGYNNLKEDIEEIVTSPYIENGSIVVDGEGKQVLIPNTPSYRDGTKEYVYTPTIGGWYNSILRVKNWLIQRLQTLDTYYSYTNN